MTFCIHIDIDKMQPMSYQMTFGIGRGFAEVQILKKVKLALSHDLFGIFR